MLNKITSAQIGSVNVKSTPGSRLMGTVSENKNVFDKLPEMIADNINLVIDALQASTYGDSGADNISITPISGISGTTVQSILESIKTFLDDTYNQGVVDGKLDEKADKTTVNQSIKTVELDSNTGVLTFTKQDGTQTTIDTMLEKIVTNFEFDSETQSLVFTASDGTINRVSIAEFITNNEFADSPQIAFAVTNGIVKATIKDGSITDAMLSSALKTVLEGYRDAANASAANASASATNARDYADSASSSKDTATQQASLASTKAAEAQRSAANAQSSAETASKKAAEASASASNASSSAGTATIKATEAATSATSASGSANVAAQKSTDSFASATKSESYAVGGTGSRTGENADNAKYYKEQTEEIKAETMTAKNAAETAKASAETAKTTAETAASNALTSAANAQKSADTAATKATEASNSAASALTAKQAAEQARDEAQDIAGGDYATNAAFNAHTSDAAKHVTSDEKLLWNNKVSAEPGMGLSANDYTDADKAKVDAALISGGTVTVAELPSLPAGSNKIGSVSVDNLPTIPASNWTMQKISDLETKIGTIIDKIGNNSTNKIIVTKGYHFFGSGEPPLTPDGATDTYTITETNSNIVKIDGIYNNTDKKIYLNFKDNNLSLNLFGDSQFYLDKGEKLEDFSGNFSEIRIDLEHASLGAVYVIAKIETDKNNLSNIGGI